MQFTIYDFFLFMSLRISWNINLDCKLADCGIKLCNLGSPCLLWAGR